jgi:hypothetical protein
MHDELRGRAPSVLARHDDDVGKPFLVAARHMGTELREERLADTRAALIHVVPDILGEAGEHGRGIAGVEGVVIALDEGFGFGSRHVGLPAEARVVSIEEPSFKIPDWA